MGDQDNVELFLKGVDAWNRGVDTFGARSEDHVTWGPASDLSDKLVGYQVFNLAKQEGTCIEQATDYRGINLDRSNLAGSQFQLPIQLPIGEQVKGFNFSRATFRYADLQGANLSGANLTEASFYYAKLQNAVLAGAALDKADLSTADLTGTDLTETRPWRACLFREPVPFQWPRGADPEGHQVRCRFDQGVFGNWVAAPTEPEVTVCITAAKRRVGSYAHR